MSKPIQSIDVSSMVPKASQTAANAVSGEDDAVSFSRVLSENEAEAAQEGSSQPAQEGGKKLPPQSASGEEQTPDQVESNSRTLTKPTINIPVETGTGEPLPVEASDEAELLQTLVKFSDSGKELPVQDTGSVEQPATQVAVVQAADLSAVALKQETPVPAPVAETPTPLQAMETLQVLQSGQAGAVPGTEHLLQMGGKAVTEQLLPAEVRGRAPAAESTASAVREAVQLAFVSQGANDGLKQSLSEGRNFQPDMKVLTVQSQTEMNSATFTQALTDSSTALPSSKVQIPVGQSGWGRAVGQQVVWFVSQNITAANMRLNPQQLGPMEMQLSMEGDKASVAFVSQHAVVRDALESAIPRLREMFAENGLNLANVNVSQQGYSGQRDQASTGSGQTAGADNSAASGGELGMAEGLSVKYTLFWG